MYDNSDSFTTYIVDGKISENGKKNPTKLSNGVKQHLYTEEFEICPPSHKLPYAKRHGQRKASFRMSALERDFYEWVKWLAAS